MFVVFIIFISLIIKLCKCLCKRIKIFFCSLYLKDVSTDPHILTQSASEVPIFVTANLMCQSHVILIAIVSEQLGTEVTVKIAASSTTDNPVSVDESQSSFKVTIPGML